MSYILWLIANALKKAVSMVVSCLILKAKKSIKYFINYNLVFFH